MMVMTDKYGREWSQCWRCGRFTDKRDLRPEPSYLTTATVQPMTCKECSPLEPRGEATIGTIAGQRDISSDWRNRADRRAAAARHRRAR